MHPNVAGKPDPFPSCRWNDDNSDGVTGPHPGYRAIDISAGAGNPVWLQVDYLPGSVGGGYLFAQDVGMGCFSKQPGDPAYVGRKIQVGIWYYDYTDFNNYADKSDAFYEHVSPANLNVWKRWNNSTSWAPLWQPGLADYLLNNTTSGGMPAGSVAQIGSSPPAGCATGNHLHQDLDSQHAGDWDRYKYAEGCFNAGGGTTWPCPSGSGWTWITGQAITGRWSNAHYFLLYSD